MPSASSAPARTASIARKTGETDIRLSLDLDGSGTSKIATGVGFFDHMLTLLARHALIDLEVIAKGDLHVDFHHTVEDVGIVLGQAILQAAGDKRGISRYGHFSLPMDEVLVNVALDLSGRPVLVTELPFTSPLIGEFPSELVVEFLRAVSSNAKLTLHVHTAANGNSHHLAEATFKGLGRALRMALARDPRETGTPSTKGML
jgi:imidazoleglycerol-phosphate dehydratase